MELIVLHVNIHTCKKTEIPNELARAVSDNISSSFWIDDVFVLRCTFYTVVVADRKINIIWSDFLDTQFLFD